MRSIRAARAARAKAVSYIEITTRSRRTLFGAGMHPNIITASLLAVLSAVNRAVDRRLPARYRRDRHLAGADRHLNSVSGKLFVLYALKSTRAAPKVCPVTCQLNAGQNRL